LDGVNKPFFCDGDMNKTTQDLMLFSQSFLSIYDTDGLVRFLNKDACEFLDVQSINLVLEDKDRDQFLLYYYDDLQGVCCEKITASDSHYHYHYYIDNNFSMLGAKNYYQCHPEIKQYPIYQGVDIYVRSPLVNVKKTLGMLEYINPNIDISAASEKKFGLLTSMLSSYVSHVIEHEIASSNCVHESTNDKPLNPLHIYDHLLVDVTNAVISKSTTKDLLESLITYLKQHFPIKEMSIIDPCNDGLSQIFYKPGPVPVYKQVYFQPQDLCQKIFADDKMVSLPINGTHKLSSTSVSFEVSETIKQVVFVPLFFRNIKQGFLLYSLDEPAKNSDLDLSLLEQIAARVALAIHSLIKQQEAERQHVQGDFIHIEDTYQHHQIFDDIISQSEAMNQVLDEVAMVADCDSTVLILGETGTGKELIAQAIHKMSGRNQKQMVKMNCAAVPEGLFESELFGHERGAFTGAINHRVGRFEQADKGTLFLDEIGDMPIALQPKLLRVLQESEFERVGKNQLIPVDVRIVVATNADLLKMINQKTFRSDLYYRLNIFPIEIPPLRKRAEDIPLLIKYFTRIIAKKMKRSITKMSSKDMHLLSTYSWPGNVRQLRNFIERCVILTRGEVLHVPVNDLAQMGLIVNETVTNKRPEFKHVVCTKSSTELSKEQIIEALQLSNGIVAGERGAAKRLGLKRTTLLSRMQKMGITSKDYLLERCD